MLYYITHHIIYNIRYKFTRLIPDIGAEKATRRWLDCVYMRLILRTEAEEEFGAKQLTIMAIRALSMTIGTPTMNRMKNDTGSGQ